MSNSGNFSRRSFLKTTGLVALFAAIPTSVKAFYHDVKNFLVPAKKMIPLSVYINNKKYNSAAIPEQPCSIYCGRISI